MVKSWKKSKSAKDVSAGDDRLSEICFSKSLLLFLVFPAHSFFPVASLKLHCYCSERLNGDDEMEKDEFWRVAMTACRRCEVSVGVTV